MPARKIVVHGDLVPSSDQQSDSVRSNIAGTADNHNIHAKRCFFISGNNRQTFTIARITPIVSPIQYMDRVDL
jgi:hypothetical protein